MTAIILETAVACEGEPCTVQSTQVYHLQNTNREQESALRVGMPLVSRACNPQQAPALSSEGASATALGGDEGYLAIWQVNLPASGSGRLILTQEVPLTTADVMRWQWDPSSLVAWGAIDGVRVELRLPIFYAADALLGVQPDSRGFDGHRFVWSYENTAELPPHAVTMLTPPAAERSANYRASGNWYELGRLLQGVQDQAAASGLVIPDLYPEIVASLSLAMEADPADAGPALDLGAVYLRRASGEPSQRLNYLVLAAGALEHALSIQPQDVSARETLCQTYYEMATAASEANDPSTALAYLRQADECGSQVSMSGLAVSEELYLRLALALARQRRVQEAYALVADQLRPETREALQEYAPPLTGLWIEADLAAGEWVILYHLRPYPPVIQPITTRLAELVAMIGSSGVAEATMQQDAGELLVRIKIAFATPEEAGAAGSHLAQALAAEPDLLAAVLAAPFQGAPPQYTVESSPLLERIVFRQGVDLSNLAERWATEAEYTSWRIVEVKGQSQEVERDRLEQQLALAMLQEQAAVWEGVPLGAHLVISLSPEQGDDHGALSWASGWGETRTIEWERVRWRWPAVGALGISIIIVLIALLRAVAKGLER